MKSNGTSNGKSNGKLNGKPNGHPNGKPNGGAKATKTHLVGNLAVGKPDVSPSAPSHTRGVRQGNRPGALARRSGIAAVDGIAKGTARRSTGIGAEHRDPIDRRSPNLSPA